MAARATRRRHNTAPMRKPRAATDLEAFVAELDAEVEARCAAMEMKSQMLADRIHTTLSIELTKLPKRVAKMSMGEFRKTYGGSVSRAVSSTPSAVRTRYAFASAKKQRKPASASTGTVVKARKQPKNLHQAVLMMNTQTPARAPRAGETILSLNGSPLGTFDLSKATGENALSKLEELRSQINTLMARIQDGGAT